MRIALVIEQFNPGGGGAERSTSQIAGELMARGHDVSIVCAITELYRKAEGFDVRPMTRSQRMRTLTMWRFASRARREMATGGYDATLSVTTAVPAMVIQPRSGTLRETFDRNIAIRTRSTTRTGKKLALALSPKRQLLLRLERAALMDPSVKRILAVSRYVQRQLEQHYAMDPAKIEVLPNASEMPTVTADQRAAWRERIRHAFNVPESSTVYLFAAHNPRLKGLDTLMRAAKLLTDRGVPHTLLLAGQIGFAWQDRAANLGIRGSVRFVGATSRMAELFCAADVTVHPTYYDPSSKVIIESLMMCTPAISTSFNGASDFLQPGGGVVRGRVIADPADAVDLARAMTELADPAERARCSAMSAGLSEELSMKRHVDRLETVLTEIAGGKALITGP